MTFLYILEAELLRMVREVSQFRKFPKYLNHIIFISSLTYITSKLFLALTISSINYDWSKLYQVYTISGLNNYIRSGTISGCRYIRVFLFQVSEDHVYDTIEFNEFLQMMSIQMTGPVTKLVLSLSHCHTIVAAFVTL